MTTWAETERVWRTQRDTWHPVKLSTDVISYPIYDWLLCNVGTRGVSWIYPETRTLCFADKDHAVQFSLTWCGS
jgi:hypothetical protein